MLRLCEDREDSRELPRTDCLLVDDSMNAGVTQNEIRGTRDRWVEMTARLKSVVAAKTRLRGKTRGGGRIYALAEVRRMVDLPEDEAEH
jgi:hypothetical protein